MRVGQRLMPSDIRNRRFFRNLGASGASKRSARYTGGLSRRACGDSGSRTRLLPAESPDRPWPPTPPGARISVTVTWAVWIELSTFSADVHFDQ